MTPGICSERRRSASRSSALAFLLATATGAAFGDIDAARDALEQRMATCAERTGYDDQATLDQNVLGPGERQWRACVYEGIEELVMPVSAIPDAYGRLISEDRVMTDLIERGKITRSDRRTRLDKLVSTIEAEERNSPSSVAPGAQQAEMEGLRDEMRAAQGEMRRMRDIQSMMAR